MIHSNFTAELHCRYGQVGVADTSFSEHPINSAAQDGWLCTRKQRPDKNGFKAVAFDFVFIEKTANRVHYHINCADAWDYSGASLERNSNGWLGLYGTHVVGRLIDAINPANLFGDREHWKIETLQEWDGDLQSAEGIEFYLRDQDGHRVAQVGTRKDEMGLGHYFLNSTKGGGEILTFTLRNITVA